MDFVVTYTAARDITLAPGELYEREDLLKEAVFRACVEMHAEQEESGWGVLFSYAGAVYEFRCTEENEWLLASHGGGHYFFVLASDPHGWWEDLLVIKRGRSVRSLWPVENP